MAVPAVVLLQVEAVRVDGGCDHDAQACWKRRGGDADVSEGPDRRRGSEMRNESWRRFTH